jgi:hypothetical protein
MIKINKIKIFTQCKKAHHTILVCVLSLLFVQFKSLAIETNIELHKTFDSGGYGYTLGITDNFFKQKAFNWRIAYNHLENVKGDWLDNEGKSYQYDFPLDTVDLMLTYRYFPRTYNKFLNKLTYEFQAGAAISVTENKFLVDENNIYFEKILSEAGDVNAVVAFSVYYKMSKQTSLYLGAKIYPDYSDFGAISSVFIGFNYHFGRQLGY